MATPIPAPPEAMTLGDMQKMMAYTQIYEKDLYEKQLKTLQKINITHAKPVVDYAWMAKKKPVSEERLPSAISSMMQAASQALALEREYGRRVRDTPLRPASGGVVRPAALAMSPRRPLPPAPPRSQPEILRAHRREPPQPAPVVGVHTADGLVSPRVVLRRPPGSTIEDKQNQNLTSARREAEGAAAAVQVPTRAAAYEAAKKSRGYAPPLPRKVGTVDAAPTAMQPGEDGLPPRAAVQPESPRKRPQSGERKKQPQPGDRRRPQSAERRVAPAQHIETNPHVLAVAKARRAAALEKTASAAAREKQKQHIDEQKRLMKAFDQDKLISDLAREIMHGDPERILAVYDRIPESLESDQVEAIKKKALAMANLEAGGKGGKSKF